MVEELSQGWACIRLVIRARTGVALFAHPLPNICSRLIERRETIWENMKRSVFGCWPIKPRCDPPEENHRFPTLKMPLGFRGPYVLDGRNSFNGKQHVHLYLLTACVVPFLVQKEEENSGWQQISSQDGYVWSSMGFFFLFLYFYFPSWHVTFSCWTKGV